ncbi:MAG: crotonase/enoyl-CoA hydratase family protein [Novosphingobium sp.]|nr:crotonase/enoyl-CoA hydratase family protein [Novosphingobium sp.]
MKREFPKNDRVTLLLDDEGIGHVRLIRAEKRNALDPAMFDALIEAGQVLFETPGLRCVVLAGEGKAFCAGLDITTFDSLSGENRRPLGQRTHGNANRFQQAALQWRKLPVPVIAAVHGICFGGGLQIAGGADIRVVAPDARLAVMEMKWGLVPDMGGFALWRDIVREDVLRELTYTNREFTGEEAVSLGFATAAHADPLGRAIAIAQEIASRSPTAIRAAKALFNRRLDLKFDDILMEESLAQQQLLGSRNQSEAMRSQFEGRPADFANP